MSLQNEDLPKQLEFFSFFTVVASLSFWVFGTVCIPEFKKKPFEILTVIFDVDGLY